MGSLNLTKVSNLQTAEVKSEIAQAQDYLI
jgi:hypothetical protein